jgi:hypothetical protein
MNVAFFEYGVFDIKVSIDEEEEEEEEEPVDFFFFWLMLMLPLLKKAPFKRNTKRTLHFKRKSISIFLPSDK